MSQIEKSIEWTVWPLRRAPVRGAVAALLSIVTVVLVEQLSIGPALPIVAIVVLAVSLAPFYVPTRHRLSPQGIAITRAGSTTRRAWSSFRSVQASEVQCILTSSLKPSFLASFRACTLLLDGNRAEVVSYAEKMVGAARERGNA